MTESGQEVDCPAHPVSVLIVRQSDAEQVSLKPQSLSVEESKDCQPNQESIESASHRANGDRSEANGGERGTKKEEGLIVMKCVQNLACSELCIEHEH